MRGESRTCWTDDQLVQHIRKWALEQSNCGFEPECLNQINDKELVPCRDVLVSRGAEALLKLLPLLEDDNPFARLNAASFAFEVAPSECRGALEGLLRWDGLLPLFALAVWSHHEPQTAPDPATLLDKLPSRSR